MTWLALGIYTKLNLMFSAETVHEILLPVEFYGKIESLYKAIMLLD